jgi:hypothetical protein
VIEGRRAGMLQGVNRSQKVNKNVGTLDVVILKNNFAMDMFKVLSNYESKL